MASIRPRGKGFEVRWLDANGVPGRAMVYSEKAAQIKKKEVELAILQGKQRRADITRMTFADFVYEHWVQTLSVEKGSRDSYSHALTKYILPEFGNQVLTEIRQIDIEKWRSSMIKGKVFVAKPLAETTVQRIVNLMAAIMKKAAVNKIIDESPFAGFTRPKAKPRKKAMHLEFEQYQKLLSLFAERIRILVQVMFYTGLRPSEALGLTWDRIDLGKMEITVDRQLSRDLNESIFVDPKTLASNRTVYFGEALKDLLIAHRENFGEGPHGLLTSNRYGGVYRYNSASDAFNKVAKRLELSVGSGLHMLRHTYASESIAAGVNMKELQEQLGHSSITETMDTYGHLMSDNRSHFAAKHDEAIKRKLKEANRGHLRAAE